MSIFLNHRINLTNPNLTKLSFVRFGLVGFLFLTGSYSMSSAQAEPYLLATWRANSYVPSFYEGKRVPIQGSVVDVRIELLSGGKIVDLKNNEIRWFLDRKKISSGIGKKNFKFLVQNSEGVDNNIKIQIVNLDGSILLERIIRIPVSRPQVALQTIYPRGLGNYSLIEASAFPYFFNVNTLNKLNFGWKVNNENVQTDEDSHRLRLELDEGQTGFLSLESEVLNPQNKLEKARVSNNFNILN